MTRQASLQEIEKNWERSKYEHKCRIFFSIAFILLIFRPTDMFGEIWVGSCFQQCFTSSHLSLFAPQNIHTKETQKPCLFDVSIWIGTSLSSFRDTAHRGTSKDTDMHTKKWGTRAKLEMDIPWQLQRTPMRMQASIVIAMSHDMSEHQYLQYWIVLD